MNVAKLKELVLPSRTMHQRALPVLIGLAYIAVIYFLGGLQNRHVAMGLLGLLGAYNEKTRKFLKYFLPFILTGIVYDSMRYYYWWGIKGHIHVSEPYYLEKAIFGFHEAGKLVTPNEFFQTHTYAVLDFFCGLAYLIFVLWYLSAAFMLYFSENLRILRAFGWCFFTVNVMGFSTYYIYPAAPPWYVTQFGLGEAQMYIHATPSAAGRFDLLFGTHLFDAMYGNSVDVYGAFPSLHVAYPLLVAWAAFVTKRFRAPAVAFYFLMCFSAIYLQHHYILDIILGTLYSFVGLLAVRCYQERRTLALVPWSERLAKLMWPVPVGAVEPGLK